MPIALAVSVAFHVGLAAVSGLFLLMGGGPRSGGEDGRLGGGDATVDIAIAGPVNRPRKAPLTPTPAVEPAPPPPPRAQARHVTRHRPLAHHEVSTDTSAAGDVTASPAPEPPPASEPSPPAAGTGADHTSSGRAPGAHQLRSLILGSAGILPGDTGHRSLLRDALACHDPVAGTWLVQKWDAIYGDWARFTLRIERHGDSLSGTITSHMWEGGPEQAAPPPTCAFGEADYTVSMRAQGFVDGTQFDFAARSYHIVHARCVVPGYGYNPDHFTGTVDAGGERLQTVNNDGGRDVNAPYTFHRISCDAGGD